MENYINLLGHQQNTTPRIELLHIKFKNLRTSSPLRTRAAPQESPKVCSNNSSPGQGF